MKTALLMFLVPSQWQ